MKPEGGVERVSERHIPRVSGQRRPHLARYVGVANTSLRIGKAQRAAGPGGPERQALPNGQTGVDFMKPSENWMPSAFMHSS